MLPRQNAEQVRVPQCNGLLNFRLGANPLFLAINVHRGGNPDLQPIRAHQLRDRGQETRLTDHVAGHNYLNNESYP